VTPAETIGLDPGLASSFYLNRAVLLFGSKVQAAMDAAGEGKKGKMAEAARTEALNRWLYKDDRPGVYRQPVATR
jgi:hypothetical protein